MKLIEKIDRENINSLLINNGQSEMNDTMIDFANTVPDIKTIQDLHTLDIAFYSYFKKSEGYEKFEKTASEIFNRKTVSGCSDICLAIAPILRFKGVPTIYVESANIEWIKDLQEGNENMSHMRGHVFLEIFLNNKWYLYDPTFHLVYDNYDFNNYSLPRNYIAFAKALNSHDLGVYNINDENQLASSILLYLNINDYNNPNYESTDTRF